MFTAAKIVHLADLFGLNYHNEREEIHEMHEKRQMDNNFMLFV